VLPVGFPLPVPGSVNCFLALMNGLSLMLAGPFRLALEAAEALRSGV
jgi:hypothetical protein